jgi:hypothetical protein
MKSSQCCLWVTVVVSLASSCIEKGDTTINRTGRDTDDRRPAAEDAGADPKASEDASRTHSSTSEPKPTSTTELTSADTADEPGVMEGIDEVTDQTPEPETTDEGAEPSEPEMTDEGAEPSEPEMTDEGTEPSEPEMSDEGAEPSETDAADDDSTPDAPDIDEVQPPTPQVGENPVPFSTNGWVDTQLNAVGIGGPFFTFTDQSDGGNSTIEPPCTDGMCFTGSDICVHGELDTVDGWGAVLALGVAHDLSGQENIYQPSIHDVRGFGFELSGTDVPENVRFTVYAADGKEYCLEVSSGTTLVGLSQLRFECWLPVPGPALGNTQGFTQLRWQSPSNRNTSFDFCLSNLTALVGVDAPEPEAEPVVELPPVTQWIDGWNDGDLQTDFPVDFAWDGPVAYPVGVGTASYLFGSESERAFVTVNFSLEDTEDEINAYPVTYLGLVPPEFLDFNGVSLTYRAEPGTDPSIVRIVVFCPELLPEADGPFMVEHRDAQLNRAWTTLGAAFADFERPDWSTGHEELTVEECVGAATYMHILIDPGLTDGGAAAGSYSFDAIGLW